MSTEWTVERLDALPEGTVIEARYSHLDFTLIRSDDIWFSPDGDSWEPTTIAECCDPIRVVSVPIDALLAEGAVDAAFDVLDEDGHNGYECRPELPADVTAKRAIRAAVAHVTGEATP